MRLTTGLLVIALIALSSSTVLAEAARAVREGAYAQWVPARVLGDGPDALAVLNPSSPLAETLAVRSLGIVEVESGLRPSSVNMIRGLCFGLALGFVATGISYKLQSGDCHGEDCGLGAGGYILTGTAIGGGVGLAIGTIPVRSWDRIFVSPGARRWLDSQRWPR